MIKKFYKKKYNINLIYYNFEFYFEKFKIENYYIVIREIFFKFKYYILILNKIYDIIIFNKILKY